MATTKHRINITAEPAIEKALKHAAKRDGVPVAAKAAELLEIGLSLEEDTALSAIASSRAAQKVKFVSHDEAWA